jgi:RimJ/RimL family protein N-acetyltransferase
LEDAPAMFARYASDPEVTRFLGWPRHRTVVDTEAFVRFADVEWSHGAAGPLLIWSRETGELLGSTGLSFESPRTASTGYVLARDAWGRGLATEALQAMVTLARRLDAATLYALCHPDHAASIRVLEKCGFARDRDRETDAEFPNLSPAVATRARRYTLSL